MSKGKAKSQAQEVAQAPLVLQVPQVLQAVGVEAGIKRRKISIGVCLLCHSLRKIDFVMVNMLLL